LHCFQIDRRGIGPEADAQDTLQLDEPLLAELYSASISGRVATGPRAGRPIVRLADEVESKNAEAKPESCCAMVEGFNVHVGVAVPEHDRLRYKLKRRWKDGTKAVIYEPMELMERLAALVPPPRFTILFGIMGCWPLPQASGDTLFRKINRRSRRRILAAGNSRVL
jgi:hypothetical protein